MDELGNEMNYLTSIRIGDHESDAFIQEFIALPPNTTKAQQKNTEKLRDDLRARYHQAPDLTALPDTSYRLINAVSDFATHTTPLRQTPNHRENLFALTIDGHPLNETIGDILLDWKKVMSRIPDISEPDIKDWEKARLKIFLTLTAENLRQQGDTYVLTNRSTLQPKEYLSDSLYYYNGKKLTIAGTAGNIPEVCEDHGKPPVSGKAGGMTEFVVCSVSMYVVLLLLIKGLRAGKNSSVITGKKATERC